MSARILVAGVVIAAASLLMLSSTRSVARSAEAQLLYENHFEAAAPAAPFDVLARVIDFEPGGWQPPHTHPGGAFVTVLEGEWTNIRIVDGRFLEPEAYYPGEKILEPAWSIHQAGSFGGGRTRVLVTRLQAADLTETLLLPIESARPGAARPRVPYRAEARVDSLAGPLGVYHQVWVLPQGTELPQHFHPGVELGLVLEGEVVATHGIEERLVDGQSVTLGPGEAHTIRNDGGTPARFATTLVVAAGAPKSFANE